MFAVQIRRVDDQPTDEPVDTHADRPSMKVGDRYRLACGHEGRVVWISPTMDRFAVKGVKRSCRTCGKRTSGEWSPSVYLLSGDERAAQRQAIGGQRHFRRVAGPEADPGRPFTPLRLRRW